MAGFDLLRVDDAETGAMTKVGASPKQCYYHGRLLRRDDTEGNFVKFSRAGDGLYVVRGLTDPADGTNPIGTILESDEEDNAAYAYIAARGSCVRLLERGRGTSPWDPDKVVIHDTRPVLIDGQCAAPAP